MEPASSKDRNRDERQTWRPNLGRNAIRFQTTDRISRSRRARRRTFGNTRHGRYRLTAGATFPILPILCVAREIRIGIWEDRNVRPTQGSCNRDISNGGGARASTRLQVQTSWSEKTASSTGAGKGPERIQVFHPSLGPGSASVLSRHGGTASALRTACTSKSSSSPT